MKSQLQFVLILILLGYATTTLGGGLTPPKGKGGTTTCGNSKAKGTISSNDNCDNQVPGNGDNCKVLLTGEVINCNQVIEDGFKLTTVIEQPNANPASFPDAITLHVTVKDEIGGAVRLDYVHQLAATDIYKENWRA